MRKLIAKILCKLNIHLWRGVISEEGYSESFCQYCYKSLGNEDI